ncbi:adenine-specific methyltransferase EcoRI family protein [Arenibacter sp. BSSL-BM3]|uniref:Adenine-specific methyltransferase EcoRI family protein n=1 Tax=Arenibacter arenosicollis TaxID=2762274 RepID=A0ABR7QI22_9FLAO|nr:adenine-specific methyltransferase EcoRI family protein [Arenibacter arenosicollis]MBC8766842.1 adenine-specific methyltransferase EcoRI family protein [Arenibacter arenosicollis]
MANSNLTKAKRAKNDEFYTQYHDIEKEINAYLDFNKDVFRGKVVLLPCDDPEWSNFTKFFAQNFERFGLKKLISTSYAVDSKHYKGGYQVTMFEESAPQYDSGKTTKNGKIFTLTHDKSGDGKIDVDDLEWNYLDGDGDFNSKEVKKLRNEADIIITNPPFSLFRDFLAWIVEADKQFVIIGNMNAITYKEVFPLIKENKMWLGATGNGSDMVFAVPEGTEVDEKDRQKAARLGYVGDYTRLGNSCWFTTIDHGRRHRPLQLMTMADNLRFNKKMKGRETYEEYDNYDAIEVSFTDAIPSDFDGMMGVPISFLDKRNPEQFEILGMCENEDLYDLKTKVYTTAECKQAYLAKFGKKGTYDLNASGVVFRDGLFEKVYQRVLIKHKSVSK